MQHNVLELFNIGIGPSSSHTIGPMRAALAFDKNLKQLGYFDTTNKISVELFGSLSLTGKGHGTDKAIILGLSGYIPETVNPEIAPELMDNLKKTHLLNLFANKAIKFDPKKDLVFHMQSVLPKHPNGMRFRAFNSKKELLHEDIYYSIGGGFIVHDSETDYLSANQEASTTPEVDTTFPFPYYCAEDLLTLCNKHNKSIAEISYINEMATMPEEEIHVQIDNIWQTMNNSIERGIATEGILPGGLKVKRRAAKLYAKMQGQDLTDTNWLNVFAIAVNEENAAGNRIVTAPTNGAAGVIPAIFKYYQQRYHDFSKESLYKYILTAGAIGLLFKMGASISAAEMGCQGEIGVASSMAAGGLTALLGGTPDQVEKAAEIAIEHHLGLTCDPIKGLVQIPCIERNAMGAIKAYNAAQIVLMESDDHIVSLDNAIKTMKETGLAMCNSLKETSRGGLAKNVPEC